MALLLVLFLQRTLTCGSLNNLTAPRKRVNRKIRGVQGGGGVAESAERHAGHAGHSGHAGHAGLVTSVCTEQDRHGHFYKCYTFVLFVKRVTNFPIK